MELFFSIVDLAEPSYLSSRAGLRLFMKQDRNKIWASLRVMTTGKRRGICRNSRVLNGGERLRERIGQNLGSLQVVSLAKQFRVFQRVIQILRCISAKKKLKWKKTS